MWTTSYLFAEGGKLTENLECALRERWAISAGAPLTNGKELISLGMELNMAEQTATEYNKLCRKFLQNVGTTSITFVNKPQPGGKRVLTARLAWAKAREHYNKLT